MSAKSRQALKAVGKGQATSDVMEAIIRGMGSAHGKTNLARDNDGAKFVGPKTRTPTYKTAKGLSRLLSEASGLCLDVKEEGDWRRYYRIVFFPDLPGFLSPPSP